MKITSDRRPDKCRTRWRRFAHVSIWIGLITLFSCRPHAYQINVTEQTDGFGYQILVDGKVKIDQPFIPVLAERVAFGTYKDARKTAEVVVSRLKTGKDFTLTREDLTALHLAGDKE